MVSGGAIFVIISVLVIAGDAMPKQYVGETHLMRNHFLMSQDSAIKYLNEVDGDLEKVRKESYVVLKDLQDNREKYPTKVVGHAVAKVIERDAETLLKSFKEIQTLIYPNAVL